MISPDWKGETVFIVAGGTSVASQNTDLLRGRKVIVVNRSWERCPWADILFFADDRWWREFRTDVLAGFSGKIITSAPDVHHPRFIKMKRSVGEAQLSRQRDTVMVRKSSVTGALNVAMHLGVALIVLLGVDGCPADNGRLHHHEEYSSALTNADDFQEQRRDFVNASRTLRDRGITVANASPISELHDIWSHVPFEAYL